MSNNPYARPCFERELTEEEQEEIDNYYDDDSEYKSSDSDSEYIPNEKDSDYDEPGASETLQDVELQELMHSFENEGEDSSSDVSEEVVEANRGQKYCGQGRNNKTVWWSMPLRGETNRKYLLKAERNASRASCTRIFNEKKEAFQQIFTPAIIEEIVIETNRKAKRIYDQSEHDNILTMRQWKNTNADEIYAYIAILLYSGAEKSNMVIIADLWHTSSSPFFRAVMSLVRFEQLTRFIRFDDSRTRLERLKYDKLAPIRYIWNTFQTNLTTCFVPSLELCVDEQLVVTRNRCSFRQYIPSKPGKYGIKIFWLVDSRINYPVAGEVYVGQQPNEDRSKGISHNLVMRLARKYFNLGANITMDNFFTSFDLAIDLAKEQTTILGTIRRNKRELPKLFTSLEEAKKRGANNAIFCFSGPCELVSYNSKKKKNVCLLSTAHATEEIDETTGKPIAIVDYNKNKGGVDTMDKMLRCFTCKRKCNRWPMLLFQNMLDVAAFAAYRIMEVCHPAMKSNKSQKRKKFIKELAMDLAQNQLKSRSETTHKSEVLGAMKLIHFDTGRNNHPRRTLPTIEHNNPKRRCEVCKHFRDKKRDTKTTAVCDVCKKLFCVQHLIRTCESCYLERDNNVVTSSDSNDDMPSTSTRQQQKRPRLSPF